MKVLRFLLFPFAILYAIITTVRNFLFDVGVLKSTSFEKPVIAVGNLSVGGTGKTPQIEYLIRLLRANRKLAVLSRGYGRKTNGFICADETKSSEDIGDEPLQFYKKFSDITVAVDENRVHGIAQLRDAELVLLDDAYQHRKVKAGFYVLLTKFDALFSNDFVLPVGNLRERRVGASRADVVVVTKCPDIINSVQIKATEQLIRRYFKGPIFFSKISYANVLLSNGEQQIVASELNKYEILLVTGIANPSPLLQYLDGLNCKYTHQSYPDHHQFTTTDIVQLNKQFLGLKSENKVMVTTEKDFVRLSEKIDTLFYLPIDTAFVNCKGEFDLLITNYVNSAL
ncbi:MAG: tetraacyldisaccharide 4'-kinase [Flavobacteriaceae bacterium]|nr:tetraacyldisaccharide 4'-kinase [Flavobacteriaceae bacterium]